MPVTRCTLVSLDPQFHSVLDDPCLAMAFNKYCAGARGSAASGSGRQSMCCAVAQACGYLESDPKVHTRRLKCLSACGSIALSSS